MSGTNNLDLSFDDILSDAGINDQENSPEPTKEDLAQQLADAKEQAQKATQSRDKVSGDYQQLRSKFDTVTDRYGKTVAWVEGTGMARYDKDTGALIRVNEQPANAQVPDFDREEKKIDKAIGKLEKQLRDGKIETDDYFEKIEDLRDQKNDIAESRQDRQSRTPQKTNQPAERAEPVKHQDLQPRGFEAVDNTAEYQKIAELRPEIQDDNSPLWQEMQRVFNQNPNYYAKGNPNDGKGDPKIYQELIAAASKSIGSNDPGYSQPRNHGYRQQEKSASHLSKEDTQDLIARGFNDKGLLTSINKSIGAWETSGGRDGIVMDY